MIKNPVYTARVGELRRLFPEAKFIHIHRNPFDVFLSMRNFYARLLEVMALQKVPEGLDVDATILRVYDRMMQDFAEQTSDLAAPDFVEIPYARLDEDPMGALAEIYGTLKLEGFEAARPAFETYLTSVKSFRKNAFRGDRATVEMLCERWRQWIERWGYVPPTLSGTGAPA